MSLCEPGFPQMYLCCENSEDFHESSWRRRLKVNIPGKFREYSGGELAPPCIFTEIG
jgi:hypothetical protein